MGRGLDNGVTFYIWGASGRNWEGRQTIMQHFRAKRSFGSGQIPIVSKAVF